MEEGKTYQKRERSTSNLPQKKDAGTFTSLKFGLLIVNLYFCRYVRIKGTLCEDSITDKDLFEKKKCYIRKKMVTTRSLSLALILNLLQRKNCKDPLNLGAPISKKHVPQREPHHVRTIHHRSASGLISL